MVGATIGLHTHTIDGLERGCPSPMRAILRMANSRGVAELANPPQGSLAPEGGRQDSAGLPGIPFSARVSGVRGLPHGVVRVACFSIMEREGAVVSVGGVRCCRRQRRRVGGWAGASVWTGSLSAAKKKEWAMHARRLPASQKHVSHPTKPSHRGGTGAAGVGVDSSRSIRQSSKGQPSHSHDALPAAGGQPPGAHGCVPSYT